MDSAKDLDDLLRATLERLGQRSREARASYRLQLCRQLRFRDAAGVCAYLEALGISDLYLSPFLKPLPGSQHGYDVVDHQAINPELGGEEDLEALEQAAARHGLGILLDVVPNHMGIGEGNRLWMDVLENGASSPAARFFDIDWRPIKEELQGKVLLPILGDQYGRILERGELRLAQVGGAFEIRYHEHRFPVDPRTYPRILSHRLPELAVRLGAENERLQDHQSLLTALGALPERRDLARAAERQREKEVQKRRLARLCERAPEIAAFVSENVDLFNGRPGEPVSFDLLDGLLDAQAYRLAHWRVAGEEINYRRFFDMDHLAAIRVEDPLVFEEVHRRIFECVERGRISGLRVDHPDGLYDPTEYFRRLQARYALLVGKRVHGEGGYPESWETLEPALRARLEREAEVAETPFRPLYVVAEKVLASRERIPPAWAIHGTTGYDFLNAVGGLFVREDSAAAFDRLYGNAVGRPLVFPELVYGAKQLILGSTMSSEIHVLARELNRISELNRRTRDFTLGSLTRALVEFCACFPVYRTYLREGDEPIDERDRRYLLGAIEQAKRRNPTQSASVYDFLADVLLRRSGDLSPEERRAQTSLALRLQQLTAPVMARGVEDTVFYVYNRLVSLNEVGGEPDRFGTPVAAFHAQNRDRSEAYPASLLATATHDTKRGEDVRARLHVLSELPAEWEARLAQWRELNRIHRVGLDPDANAEILLYQTLLGVWPFGEISERRWRELLDRLELYFLKAAREAKAHTSWINPNRQYEEALSSFLRHILPEVPPPQGTTPFLAAFLPFQRWIARCGVLTSLSQLLLKAASPGVPDFYQGCELWDLSLVDPDNRRPVDFKLRARLLKDIRSDGADRPQRRAALAQALLAHADDGRVKLYATYLLLQARRAEGSPLQGGSYLPLAGGGAQAERVVAFLRRRGPQAALAVAPRLWAGLLGTEGQPLDPAATWGDGWLELPDDLAAKRPVDLFTALPATAERFGGRPVLPLANLLSRFPIALLQWE
ncbi:MAG: malto-oligosyltrehalose synthase [Myxococcales bacterium]